VFDMERSGAGITWDHLAGVDAEPRPRPWLVDVVEDRDLWRYRFGDRTKHVAAYLATLPMTFEAWDELLGEGIEQAAAKGSSIQAYIDRYGEKVSRHALFREIGGHTVPLINIAPENCSDHIERLCKLHPQYPFAGSFFLRGDGRWQFSLRSRGEFDVSEVARRFGGGGHRNAAGFEVPALPWEAAQK
jgi:oligoribonuclease NrnB/cAMP/cGMP phosphodiesterase (DHH superfamily)